MVRLTSGWIVWLLLMGEGTGELPEGKTDSELSNPLVSRVSRTLFGTLLATEDKSCEGKRLLAMSRLDPDFLDSCVLCARELLLAYVPTRVDREAGPSE